MGGGAGAGFCSDIFGDYTKGSKWCEDSVQYCDLLDNNLIANTPCVQNMEALKRAFKLKVDSPGVALSVPGCLSPCVSAFFVSHKCML